MSAPARLVPSSFLSQELRHIVPDILPQQILFTLISAPINIRWQEELERALPSFVNQPDSHVSVKDKPVTKPVRSNRNTVAKIVLDQTLGATFNVVLFIALMGALKGAPMNQTLGKVQRVSL